MSPSQDSFLLALLVFFLPPSDANTCTEGFLTEVNKLNITQHCDRKTLRSEFAWNFDNATRRLDVAFGARLKGDDAAWLAWGLNPQGPHMIGTSALIGIRHTGGALVGRKYRITEDTKRGCPLEPSEDVGLDVRNFTFHFVKPIEYYVIGATVILPDEFNQSRTHIVWQIGIADVADGRPLTHHKTLEHLDSAETVDLGSNHVPGHNPVLRRRLRTAHGILNILGWGILLPVGVIVARYFKKYPKQWPWWYVFHVGCQSAGYILGSIGWAIGLFLGGFSKYYTFSTHRILAIFIFTFATIQMIALRLKPKGWDEYRPHWNMYHHSLGYALLAVMAVNIFQGIKILAFQPHQSWKWVYIAVLGVLGGVAIILEAYARHKFLPKDRKPKLAVDPQPSAVQPPQA